MMDYEGVLCVLLHAATRTRHEYESAQAQLDPDYPGYRYYQEQWTHQQELATTLEAMFDTALDWLREGEIGRVMARHIRDLAADPHYVRDYPSQVLFDQPQGGEPEEP